MTEYPSAEHRQAVRKHTSRAARELADLISQAELLMRRLENGGEIATETARGLTEKATVAVERIAMLEVLRDVLEWHEAGKADAGLSEAHARDARPYSGNRRCLFNCPHLAKWDVGGFLSCDDEAHLIRATDALKRRRELEDEAEEGVAARERGVTISGSTGVQFGDGNNQTLTFGGSS